MKPVPEHGSSWLCGLAAQELVVIMSAEWGSPAGAKCENVLQGGEHHWAHISQMLLSGMSAAGREAPLLDGGADSMKLLNRALGILLQEPILHKETAPKT